MKNSLYAHARVILMFLFLFLIMIALVTVSIYGTYKVTNTVHTNLVRSLKINQVYVHPKLFNWYVLYHIHCKHLNQHQLSDLQMASVNQIYTNSRILKKKSKIRRNFFQQIVSNPCTFVSNTATTRGIVVLFYCNLIVYLCLLQQGHFYDNIHNWP